MFILICLNLHDANPTKWSNTLKQFVDNIMALNHLDSALEEIYCTNKNRRWGIPSEAQTHKDPIMKSLIRSDSDKKGISSVSYDLRRCETDIQKISDFQKNEKRIGFTHAIDVNVQSKSKTLHGDFVIGFTLSHQLLPLESYITDVKVRTKLSGKVYLLPTIKN